METAIAVLLLLLVKHFVCDFPLQSFPWMYENKGTFGHPGGLVHSLVHVIGSFLVLFFFFPINVMFVSMLMWEFFLHYMIDYGKVRCCREFNLLPTNSQMYWIILGFDQLLHHATYVGMTLVLLIVNTQPTFCIGIDSLKRLM